VWCGSVDSVDSVPVCTQSIIAKNHEAVAIEEANERAQHNACKDLAKLEAVIGEVEAALQCDEALTAFEEESECQAVEDMRRHFDRLREAVTQQEEKLEEKLDQLKNVRIDASAAAATTKRMEQSWEEEELIITSGRLVKSALVDAALH